MRALRNDGGSQDKVLSATIWQVRVAALRALCQLSIQQGDVHGLLQLLDDGMELMVSAESSADSATPNLARLVWQPVLAAAALQPFSGARAEVLSRVKTWQARPLVIDLVQRQHCENCHCSFKRHRRMMCTVFKVNAGASMTFSSNA